MSAKDCVTSFLHVEGVDKLITQTQVFQGTNCPLELSQSSSKENPVNLSGLVSDSKGHNVPVSVSCGFVRHGGKDFVVVDSRLFPVDELRLQGVLSGSDVGELAYVLKYLRKAVCGA